MITCGAATIKLLEKYDVDTIFGIPGVHTLEFYRGLGESSIQHVQTRHEQGAAFMADGYARASGRPGICLLISGPGVINGLTAIGQSYADSVPVLMLSSTTASHSLGKGWGCLHEVPDLQAVTTPLTALSATARSPEDVPELIGQAFSIFASERPRPVHIAIPIDVLAQPVARPERWQTVTLPARPLPDPSAVAGAALLLAQAERPLLLVGGGAVGAGPALATIAETLNASIVSSNAGKGVVPESHPFNLGGSIWRRPVQDHIANADVILAIGTELSETDSFVERLAFNGKLIRVDIDPRKINDLYPADVGIVADATKTAQSLLTVLKAHDVKPADRDTAAVVNMINDQMMDALSDHEKRHLVLLNRLREILPADTIIAGDITQLVYTGSFTFPVEQPRLWHYPAGFCTLGCGLPNGIGAKFAMPEQPVVVLAGDGGFMFTVQELITAAELGIGLPIIIWENGGYLQIKEDMVRAEIEPVGVDGRNPEFIGLAQAMGCHAIRPESLKEFEEAVRSALKGERPTVIVVAEGSEWLTQAPE